MANYNGLTIATGARQSVTAHLSNSISFLVNILLLLCKFLSMTSEESLYYVSEGEHIWKTH
jgi:hypothetical protein